MASIDEVFMNTLIPINYVLPQPWPIQMTKMMLGCLHSAAQSDASPGNKLFVGEDWRNVIGCGWRGQFSRELRRNLSFKGDFILRPWRQHQDGEKAVAQQRQKWTLD